jgi:multidrug transporter EmrE-like cation transporter
MKPGYIFLILAVFCEAIYAILHKPAGGNTDAFLGSAIIGFTAGICGLIGCLASWYATGEAPSWTYAGIVFSLAVGVAAFGIDFSTLKAYSPQHDLPLYLVATLIIAIVPISSTLADCCFYKKIPSLEEFFLIIVITVASVKLSWGK